MNTLDGVMEHLQNAYADLQYRMDKDENEVSDEEYDTMVMVSAHIEYAMDKLDFLTDTE